MTTKPTGETPRTEIERRVADMVKHHDVTPVKPEERTELIEVVRRRIKSMAEEYNDDFMRAPRRMLADYVALERQLSDRDRALKERDDRIAVLEKALREARGYVHARLLEAAKDRHSFVSANAAESLRLIDAALADTTGKGP